MQILSESMSCFLMHEIKFNITKGGKTETVITKIPANWQECSEELILDAMPIVMMNEKNGAVLTRLLHLSMKDTNNFLTSLQPDLIIELLPCVEWMFELCCIGFNNIKPFTSSNKKSFCKITVINLFIPVTGIP